MIKTPIKAGELAQYTARAAVELGHKAHRIEKEIEECIATVGETEEARTSAVERLSLQVDELLADLTQIARETCEVAAHRPARRCRTNMASKSQRKEYRLAAQLQTAIRVARHDDWEQHPGWDKVTHPDVPHRPGPHQTVEEWVETLKQQRAEAKTRLTRLRKEEKREQGRQQREKWQREYPTRMKRGNREIFRDDDVPDLVAAQHPEKGLVTSPDEITEAFTLHTRKLFTPTLPKGAEYDRGAPSHPWTQGWKGGP